MTMKAAEIMTTEVAKIKGSETVAKAVQLMREKNIRTLIVDRRHDEDAYGIITETDIVYKSSLSVKIRKKCASMK